MTTELRGVIPITATPFDPRARWTRPASARWFEFEARCGVHGLTLLGIMGEAHKLSETERRRLAEVFAPSVSRTAYQIAPPATINESSASKLADLARLMGEEGRGAHRRSRWAPLVIAFSPPGTRPPVPGLRE